MKVYTCFLLFGIFAYTNSITRIRHRGHHRVVNLPQETVREYSYDEYSGDTKNLDNVRNFQTRGTTVQDKNMKLVFRAPRVETFTNFIQEAVKILNTYEDTAFEDFFHILDNEIRKYHYSGCKFSELTQNSDTRSLLAGLFKLIRGKSASFTKAKINEVVDMMKNERYDKNVKELLDYINSLYSNTELNFLSVLNELKYNRNTKSVKTHNNLQVIRRGVRAVLFNPYTELDTYTKRELKERIETFWKQFKNNPASSAEMSDITYTDPVIKSVNNSVKVNIMNEVKNPERYSKNDPRAKSKNKRERIVSIDTYGERYQRGETDKDESSNESEKQISNYNTDEISSGQSFDSSSNSIKNSQERQEEYNTQRYMTLYTEEITYKVMTKRPKVKKLPTTTSAPRERDVSSDRKENIEKFRANHDTDDTTLNISNSSHDTKSGLTLESKNEWRARENYDKQQKHGKANESRSKSKQKNVEIISQYDAVIDVQLANTDILKYLRMLEPLGVDAKYETTLYPKSAIQIEPVPTKSIIRPRFMRAQAEFKPQKPTASTESSSRYSNRNKTFRRHLSDFKKNIASPLPNEVQQLMKDKNQNKKYLRRFDNDTIVDNFITYVIKRINAIENELNELKQMNDFSFRNNTYGDEAKNVTDKFEAKDIVESKRKDMKGNVTQAFLKEDHDLNNKEVKNVHEFTTRNNTMDTESSTNNTKTHKLNIVMMDAVNAAVIENDNTAKVTNRISKINVNVTNKLNKEVINNDVTSSTVSLVKVKNTTKLESVVATPKVSITRRAITYSKPSFYDSEQEKRPTVRNSLFDSFLEHINDGIDLRM